MSKTLLVILVLAIFATVCLSQERYPAGVNPASCPNYPFCNTAGNGAPAGYRFDARHAYPAGIDASTCPFFPYC